MLIPLAIQVESFSQWLFKQSVVVVILVVVLGAIARYFIKRDEARDKKEEKKDAELALERAKHEENLKNQIDKGERRFDKFDVALERRDVIARDTAKAFEVVGDRLRDLADELRGSKR